MYRVSISVTVWPSEVEGVVCSGIRKDSENRATFQHAEFLRIQLRLQTAKLLPISVFRRPALCPGPSISGRPATASTTRSATADRHHELAGNVCGAHRYGRATADAHRTWGPPGGLPWCASAPRMVSRAPLASEECGVQSAEYRLRSAECGVRNAECRKLSAISRTISPPRHNEGEGAEPCSDFRPSVRRLRFRLVDRIPTSDLLSVAYASGSWTEYRLPRCRPSRLKPHASRLKLHDSSLKPHASIQRRIVPPVAGKPLGMRGGSLSRRLTPPSGNPVATGAAALGWVAITSRGAGPTATTRT